MNTLNDAKARNVSEKQHQQKKEENTHEHKEGNDSQKEKHKKRHEKKKNCTATPTTIQTASNIDGTNFNNSSAGNSNNLNTNNTFNLSNITLATQFSIQRTDSEGCLRMKISAIRPSTSLAATTVATVSTTSLDPTNILDSPSSIQNASYSKSEILKEDKNLQKRCGTLDSLKVDVLQTSQDKKRCKSENKSNMSSIIVNPLSKIKKDILQQSSLTKPMSPTTTRACISDVTDSGCSEATNTTIATVGQEKSSKRKIKRKKTFLKGSETKRALKSLQSLEISMENAFSTDSENEPLAQKLISNVETITQRAPRLLLTAINSKSCTSNINAPASHLHTTLSSLQHGNDHIGLSSSDNELPNVRAAIERVVGESDEDDNLSSHFHKAKTKYLPQYQSTLLQDFMEKTQMLGQTPKASDSVKSKNSFSQNEVLLQLNTNSQSESIVSSSVSNTKKKRGRPKKLGKDHDIVINLTSPVHVNNKVSNINESVDSGIISTTSISTQSTSPHPCTTLASSSTNDNTSSTNSPNKILNTTPEKQTIELSSLSSTSKPKIDIALLDKRMYATERVLYPPPRNKRRQSTNVTLASGSDKQRSTSSHPQQQMLKDDLDPVWRKIDINRKFRRPSVCSTTGYKSDGGGDNRIKERPIKSTVCSKILAAKSGYVSDYGTSSLRLSRYSKHGSHNSGYKSDASCKSRYSLKSCVSRKSRAKSCGYRSDCKESVLGSSKSSKFRRKRRASIIQKSMGTSKDEQDILQLAGLSLGQSSEESNEYVCKPSLEKLPTTSVSKKYGEINRYIATGEYFGRGCSGQNNSQNSFASISNSSSRIFDLSNDVPQTPAKTTLLHRKNSTTSEFAHDLLQLHGSHQTVRKIKSRRSSVASFCSSYYSVGTTKLKRHRKRKGFRFHNSSSSKNSVIDSKLLTEIEILTNTFSSRCRIQSSNLADKTTGGNLSQKEKLMAEATKLQQSLAAAAASASTSVSSSKRDLRDKRSVKKRKVSENLDFAMLSARAENNCLTSGSNSGQGTSSKRRHKKANSSSPDDHKLPLKKRHYLLTPGDKSSEVAVAVAAKLFANNAEAWAAAAAAAKSTANTKSQQQFNAKTAKANLTPKKRHLLQQTPHVISEDSNSNKTVSTLSPLRVAVGDPNSISGGKLLDISPQSLNSLKQVTEAVNKKRYRLEGVVSKIATNHSDDILNVSKTKSNVSTALQIESESSSCPPPGVFEPSVELEIQIPPITKLGEAASTIITKSEVDSPLLIDLNKGFADAVMKGNGPRVVESLLNKTGGNLILKRKRKKINRTGFPTVRRKKRKITESLILDVAADINERPEHVNNKVLSETVNKCQEKQCDRVPQQGEASQAFLERNNRTPRLSVVALERLQESPQSTKEKTISKEIFAETLSTPKKRHNKHLSRRKLTKEEKITSFKETNLKTLLETKPGQESEKPEQLRDKDDDDKPLASRVRRNKVNAKKTESVIKSSTVRKSLISKAAKSLLESNIKLPAGVDPKIILSCKIKLKRRNSIHPLTAAKSPVILTPLEPLITEILRTPEEIELDAKAKDYNIDYLEHDILPINESNLSTVSGDTEASDTGDEKSSSNSLVTKKMKITKKTYLPAGLFSDYFKVDYTTTKRNLNNKKDDKRSELDKSSIVDIGNSKDVEIVKFPLLPPPPYCERYFRRTEYDFELPYDIWWAYKNSKLPNRITVPSWNFRKIRTNIYAENVKPPPIGANDHPMCNCKSDIGCGDNCLNRMVYTECSPSNCPTREKCKNQKIQKHDVAPGVERFMTENKGWGVRTKLPIEKGTYILEYVGEVVTEREFKERMATIYLNDTHHYCLHLDGGLVIDGQRMGSDCRFVNHSCEPNCEMQKWSVNGLSRMALFAKRNIAEGEELTYDYNFSLFNPSEGQPCRCNTPNCRGVIGGKSQRVKPLPIESKPAIDTIPRDDHKSRQRKRKARKNTQRQATKDIATLTRMQLLSEKEKKIIKQYSIFLIRNFEKIRAKRSKRKSASKIGLESKIQSPTKMSITSSSSNTSTPAAISQRRPSTPVSLATQISALCTARNIKTRGFTLAVQDPEVEKMAKMAKIFRTICTNLELVKNPSNDQQSLISMLQNPTLPGVGSNKKKKALKVQQKQIANNFKTIQNNIEQGYYKIPSEFSKDVHRLLDDAKETFGKKEDKLKVIQHLEKYFIEEKQKQYQALLGVLGNEDLLKDFEENSNKPVDILTHKKEILENNSTSNSSLSLINIPISTNEDIIRCICGLFRDEGLMIQCAHCMVWQHTECTKADVNADNYLCEQCEPREVNREIPLNDYTEEGYRYYLTLMRGTSLQIRQGDAVYVLRDIPFKDSAGNVVPSKKHTYETIGDFDYNECDIFRVERLWKDDVGKRFIFGHHFLRPHETFHEPSRKFYPNEVVRVPLYEVVPIDLVMGRCWVLDRTTFCKGRPIECTDETHCFICELRVDKSARFFSKAKTNHPTCTKNYAFRKFSEKLKISKTYAPHDVDPSMLKPKKQKTDNENQNTASTSTPIINSVTTNNSLNSKQELDKTPTKKRQGSKSPATVSLQISSAEVLPAPTPMIIKGKCEYLESVLKKIKSTCIPASTLNHEPPLDLTYLLAGRGARQRKILTNNPTISK